MKSIAPLCIQLPEHVSMLHYRRLGQEVGLSVSPRTIERALSRLGYSRCKACKKPFISWENQKQRKTYSENHWQKPVEFWQKHMYSDECILDTSKRGSTWVSRLPYKLYHDNCPQHTFHSRRGSVHEWSAISQD